MFAIDALFHRDCYDYYWDVYIHGQPFLSKDIGHLKLEKNRFRICSLHYQGCFCPCIFLYNMGFNMLPSNFFTSSLYFQQRYSTWRSKICNCFFLWCLALWIDHMPPVCYYTFWKSICKQQLVCKFGLSDFFITFYVNIYIVTNSHFPNNAW